MQKMRRLIATVFAVGICASLLGACASKPYSVRTNKDIAHQVQFKKTLLVVNVDGTTSTLETERFQKVFFASLRKAFDANCVKMETIYVNKLELDRGKTLRTSVAKYEPTELLEATFVPGDSFTGQNFAAIHGRFRFALSDASLQRIAWQGEVATRIDGAQEQIEAASAEFVQKLQQDGALITQCAGNGKGIKG